MSNERLESLTKSVVAVAFLIGAVWIAWQGRTYDGLQPGLMVPGMCLLVAAMFSVTGVALILRSDE